MIEKVFRDVFGREPVVVRSPGRINLIGEHTDYNNGFSLPAAINKYVYVAAGKRDDGLFCFFSVQYSEQYELNTSDIKPMNGKWLNYVLAVTDQLIQRGNAIGGFNMVIDGDIPIGAGMASSAALECAVCMAISKLFDLKISKLATALICFAAEYDYAGVKCGVTDQYASVFGKKGFAMKLDCRKHWHEYIPITLQGYKIVLFNSNVKHSLAASACNKHREECEAGVAELKKHLPTISSLRDATIPMVEKYIIDPILKKRCEFVLRENARLKAACEDLLIGDVKSFGKKMFETHKGLSKDYEVSCLELDWLVNIVAPSQVVAGARMMGGGFGGCTMNIIRNDTVDEMSDWVSKTYEKAMGKKLEVYTVETADGTEVLPMPHIENREASFPY